ncbi:MAG: hypothetical protein GY820_30265, partial [Gammaproteobacteria bacterium]|nr:hypothetical protein [Gammaproteobacteria bacterium]
MQMDMVEAIKNFQSSVSRKARIRIRALNCGRCLIVAQLIFLSAAQAAPAGGNIVGGSGAINANGLTTTINQNSSSLAINWDSFDVNSNEI